MRYWDASKAGRPLAEFELQGSGDGRVVMSTDVKKLAAFSQTNVKVWEVDTERDLLIADLTKAGRVNELRWVDGFHKELQGRNGGGDPWRTDGRLAAVVLQPPAAPQ